MGKLEWGLIFSAILISTLLFVFVRPAVRNMFEASHQRDKDHFISECLNVYPNQGLQFCKRKYFDLLHGLNKGCEDE